MFYGNKYRYVIVGLTFFNALSIYMGRINLSTTIEEMVHQDAVNKTKLNHILTDACPMDSASLRNESVKPFNLSRPSVINESRAEKFSWNEKTQGLILGAFFWGYFMFQIPGGRFAETIGPRVLVSFGVIISGIINLLTPLMAHYFYLFIGSRVLLGATQAMVFPSAFSLVSRWIPDQERSTSLAMGSIGGSTGTIIISSLSGYLCKHGFAGGWPSVFYVTGLICIAMGIVSYFFVTNDPAEHWLVSPQELHYINENIASLKNRKNTGQKASFPWLKVMTSVPAWALAFDKIALTWCYSLVILKAPAYMENVLRMPLEKNGYFSSAIFAAFALSQLAGGIAADSIIRRKIFSSKTKVRKIFQSIAMFGTAAFLVLIPLLSGCNQAVFLLIMVLSQATFGLLSGGELAIPSDMYNEGAATLFAIAQMMAMTTGFTGPYLTGLVLDLEPTKPKQQWAYIIYFTAALNCFGGLVFALFASAEPQNWTHSNADDSCKQAQIREKDKNELD